MIAPTGAALAPRQRGSVKNPATGLRFSAILIRRIVPTQQANGSRCSAILNRLRFESSLDRFPTRGKNAGELGEPEARTRKTSGLVVMAQ